MEKITKHGKFWLDNKQNAIPGTIEFLDNSKVIIFVHGILSSYKMMEFKGEHRELNGEIYNEYDIKIINPVSYPRRGINEKHDCEVYEGDFYIKGKNDLFTENKKYREIKWSLDEYESWINIYPCSIKKYGESYTVSIDKECMEKYEWDSEVGLVKICFEEKLDNWFLCNNSSKFEISGSWYLYITINKPEEEIDRIIEISQLVERFFITLVSNNFTIKNPVISDQDGNEYKLSFITYDYRKTNRNNMFVSQLKIFSENFGKILGKYINSYEHYLSGFYSYTSLFVNGGFNETRFASCISGLEAIHTKDFGKYKIKKSRDDIKRTFKEKLIDCTLFDNKERSAILYNYNKKYEFNLGERLKELTSEMDFFDKKKIDRIIENAVSVRNDIAHYGGIRDVNSIFTNKDVTFLLEIFRMIYLFSIMKVIGVDKKTISCLYNSSPDLGGPKICYETYFPKDTNTQKKKGA